MTRGRTFYRLLSHDLSYSLAYGKYKFIVFYGLIALLSLMMGAEVKSVANGNTVGTVYLLLKDNGYIKTLSDYELPYYWDFIQFFTLFLIGDFLYQDLNNNRTYVVLRCHSKLQYMLSKVCWLIIQNMLLFAGMFIVIYAVSSIVLGDFSFHSSAYFHHYIASLMNNSVSPGQLVWRIFLGYILTNLVLSSILLLLLQWLSPIVSFLGVIIISSLSTFLGTKWLPAIHSMILKQDTFNREHHLTLSFSVIYCAVCFVVIAAFTLYTFRKSEVY
ncbi:hypothetical protein GCM10011391_34980 [Pullulanibacillus camelliae]|uniref:Uncharacterized protein n=1 Tax=Pullulanibacillus camelliae TaxID=1707096 RepID=A0A8J3E152_9BACL|nr:hypothetical protein [Pullulanibacillus camelliae]GGE53103.1 hypothetical protein GCM10011391_34980 [Pullulanibacillus camelliae]